MGSAGVEWPEELLKQAASLWAEGRSASQIAKVIGRSRNAVLGKAFRLPQTFPPRQSSRPASTVRRVIEKLREPRIPVARVEKPIRTPRLPRQKPADLPSNVPDGWLREPGQHVRNDLSIFALDGVPPVAFSDLGRNACRFPLQAAEVKAGPDMPCCGAKTDDGKSYCGAHKVVMTRRAA